MSSGRGGRASTFLRPFVQNRLGIRGEMAGRPGDPIKAIARRLRSTLEEIPDP